jgi:hypothetical protein
VKNSGIASRVGDPGSPFVVIDCATVDQSLHICGFMSDGRILHTVRDPAGSWQPFWGDVGGAAGLGTNLPDNVAVAGDGGNLHVFAPTARPH